MIMNYNSIVVARNLGIEKKDRKQCNISIEKFLIQVMDIHGISGSDIINVALEKYLVEKGFLTEEILKDLDRINEFEISFYSNI